MSEEIPNFEPDAPQRIQDPEKAHVMASAGDEHRTEAARARQAADLSESLPDLDEEEDPDGELHEEKVQREEGFRTEAEGQDAIAEMEEDSAGAEFDENHR
jgi:hypothetical protein